MGCELGMKDPMSLPQFYRLFFTEADCEEFIAQHHWGEEGEEPKCPRCKAESGCITANYGSGLTLPITGVKTEISCKGLLIPKRGSKTEMLPSPPGNPIHDWRSLEKIQKLMEEHSSLSFNHRAPRKLISLPLWRLFSPSES